MCHMTFRNCIINGEDEGIITKEQAAELLESYEQMKLDLSDTMPAAMAEAKAAKDTFDLAKYNVEHKRRVSLKQAAKWRSIKLDFESYPGDAGKAAQALIAAHDVNAKYPNLEKRTQTIARLAFARMDEVLKTFKRGLFGQQNKAKINNMLREIFEEGSTGDVAAMQLAKAWKESAEYLRKTANALGMRIASRSDWGLPQIHNNLNIRKAGIDEWVKEITPLLDANKMIDENTGKAFAGGANGFHFTTALKEVWETIATDGANKIKDGKPKMGQRSLANRRQDHRFLVFKDADSWIKYQDKFGEPDVFKTMVNHIESMAKDIAELDVLGPNPKATLQAIHDLVIKEAKIKDSKPGGTGKASEKAKGQLKKMDIFYNIHNNKNNQAVDGRMANIYAGTSHVLQAAQLGAAPLSAISDLNTQRLAGKFNGLPQAKLLGTVLKQLIPFNTASKGALAVRLGLGADNWINTAISSTRYFGDMAGPEITRRISDFTMRLSGLSPMTQAGRQAFGLEYLGHMADNVGKSWDTIDSLMRLSLERYGITKGDWDIIRSTRLHEGFVDVLELESRTDILPGRGKSIATKLIDAVLTETEAAVPSASLRAREFLIGESPAGTIAGSLVRSFSMYKNYSATVYHTHINRYMNMEGSKATKASYIGDYFIGATLMGALSMQLKFMATGKDPRPMDTPEFWGSAILQGGGLGIFGDYISASRNRYGGGLAETAAGPVVGLVGDVGKLAFGGTTNFPKNFVNFMGDYTPGSRTWYLRLAFERMVMDKMQMMTNNKYKSHFRNKDKRSRKNFGAGYWWKPGKDVPSRPPNIGNALP